MKIVGHSSVEMFLRYRTVKADRLDAAMARLDAVINTPVTRPSTAVSNTSEEQVENRGGAEAGI